LFNLLKLLAEGGTMLNLTLGLLAVMTGNIFLGTTLATLKETFSKTIFWNGVLKGLFIVAGCCLMYLASWLNPDIFVAEIGGAQVNLIGAMELIFTAGIALYGVECLIKLKDMLGVKINVAAVSSAQGGAEGVTEAQKTTEIIAQAYDDAALISANEAHIQDGIRPEVSI
jgi:hypothetical protein